MTMRKTPTDVLDPKFGLDVAGYTASLGTLQTAPTLSRATAGDSLKAPAVEPKFDDFAQKEPPTRDSDSEPGTVLPLPDPQFGIDDGVFPIYGTNGVDVID